MPNFSKTFDVKTLLKTDPSIQTMPAIDTRQVNGGHLFNLNSHYYLTYMTSQ